LLLYSHNITSRLKYITAFIGRQLEGQEIEITTDKNYFKLQQEVKINYSNKKISEEEYRIQNTELLFEEGILQQNVKCFETAGYKAFFETGGDFPFDVFAASFYLLSRYEEYLPHQKDLYGRYAYENSVAFKNNFLNLPLINIWLEDLKKALKAQFPGYQTINSRFHFIPTYDIDEAYSYKHKQGWRTAGGIIKSAFNGHWSSVSERITVFRGKKKDPFDSYAWMAQLHHQYKLEPYYFFLVANKTGKYDKNILPAKKAMQQLIQDHSSHYKIGIHPSWQSGDHPGLLKLEILKLGHIAGKQIHSSRQHFIRLTLPETYRQLINVGIEADFSMGYGSINGFRASVTSAFYWYDLQKEEETRLQLYPFCFMDANSFFEQRLSPQQALEEMKQFYESTRSVNGTMITIWHNTFLGSDKLFAGWKEVYEQFIKEIFRSLPSPVVPPRE
jgi:hypothetical protein